MTMQPEHPRGRYDNVARNIHWELGRKYSLEHAEKWYKHQPQKLAENSTCKISWDFNIQCDHEIEHRRPDLIIMDKEKRTALIIDVAVPADHRVREKELEKINKYHEALKREIIRMWTLRQMGSCPSSRWRSGDRVKKTKGIFGKDWSGIVIPEEGLQKNYST